MHLTNKDLRNLQELNDILYREGSHVPENDKLYDLICRLIHQRYIENEKVKKLMQEKRKINKNYGRTPYIRKSERQANN